MRFIVIIHDFMIGAMQAKLCNKDRLLHNKPVSTSSRPCRTSHYRDTENPVEVVLNTFTVVMELHILKGVKRSKLTFLIQERPILPALLNPVQRDEMRDLLPGSSS